MKPTRRSSPQVPTRLIPFLNFKTPLQEKIPPLSPHLKQSSISHRNRIFSFEQENVNVGSNNNGLNRLCGLLLKQQKQLKIKLKKNQKLISLIKDRPNSQNVGCREFKVMNSPFKKSVQLDRAVTPSFALKKPLRQENLNINEEFTFRGFQRFPREVFRSGKKSLNNSYL